MNFNRKIEKYQSKLKNSLLKNDLKNSKIYSDKLKYYNNMVLLGGDFFENKIYDRIRTKANELSLKILVKPLLSSSDFYKNKSLTKENYDKLKENSSDLLKIFDESIVPEDNFEGCKDTHKNKDTEDPKWDYYFWVAPENCDKTLAQIIYLDILEKENETEIISLEKNNCPFENNHRINIINKFELSKKDKNPDRDEDWNNNKYSLYKLKNCIHGYVLRQLICAIYVNNALCRIINSKFDTNSLDFKRVLDEGQINEIDDDIEKAKAFANVVKIYFSKIDYTGAFNQLKNNIEVVNEIRIVNDRFANNKDFVYKKDNKDCGVFGGFLGAKCINDDSLYNTN